MRSIACFLFGLVVLTNLASVSPVERPRTYTYYDMLVDDGTPMPYWNATLTRFFKIELRCCHGSLRDVHRLFPKEVPAIMDDLVNMRNDIERDLAFYKTVWVFFKKGPNLGKYCPKIKEMLYRYLDAFGHLGKFRRVIDFGPDLAYNRYMDKFEFLIVMWHNYYDLLNRIHFGNHIPQSVDDLPHLRDVRRILFTQEEYEWLDKDRRGVLSDWDKMDPFLKHISRMRGSTFVPWTHPTERVPPSTQATRTTRPPCTTRRMHYFHKYQAKPAGTKAPATQAPTSTTLKMHFFHKFQRKPAVSTH